MSSAIGDQARLIRLGLCATGVGRQTGLHERALRCSFADEHIDQRCAEVDRALEAHPRLLGEGAHNNSLEGLGDPIPRRQLARRGWRLVHDRGEHVVVRSERGQPPGQQLEKDHTDRVEGRADIQRETAGLLRREVGARGAPRRRRSSPSDRRRGPARDRR